MKILTTEDCPMAEILQRQFAETPDVSQQVEKIIAAVKEQGDQALQAFSQKFDRADLRAFRVSEAEIAAAVAAVEPEFLAVLALAQEKITDFHRQQVRQGFVATDRQGAVMGQRILPLATVGVYVPGGTAAYPSTVLMDVLPAKIAGVQRIVMITPPDHNGEVPAVILAAAQTAGVDEIYKVGGAHGIAALAYGTESIPRVDKIVGPGNIYVAAAKRQVYGVVDIDMIAGPSDVLIIADESANPDWLAADLIAQAEHDPLAQAVLVTPVRALAEAVAQSLRQQLQTLPRQEIAQASFDNNGKMIIVKDLDEALALANQIAPEHLELAVAEPFALLGKVVNAGSVFLGHHTPEVLGDYLAGPNHTLPTEGTARFYSPLSVDDFIKKSSYLYYPATALAEVGRQVAYFAEKEGLSGHARSATIRLQDNRFGTAEQD